jgi:hypothetical protein
MFGQPERVIFWGLYNGHDTTKTSTTLLWIFSLFCTTPGRIRHPHSFEISFGLRFKSFDISFANAPFYVSHGLVV